jgi:hypothetical protein
MGGMGDPNATQDRQKSAMMNMGKMQEQMRNSQARTNAMQGGGQGGAPGAAGAGAGGGAGAAAEEPADFHSPEGAVKGFLSALKAKDADRLNESTAIRAQQEAGSSKNREIFKKIFDLTLSDSELDDLGKKFEGYQIAGENPPQSTGKVGVIIRKPGRNGAYLQRLVTVRREKKGWGVFDVGPEMEFKAMGRVPTKTKR